jgi:hypothetical protein
VKHLGTADVVWYHGFHANCSRREGTGGSSMSQPTRPKDLGQEAHYRGGLEDISLIYLVN